MLITCIYEIFSDYSKYGEHMQVLALSACRANMTHIGTGVADAVVAKENSIEISQQVRIDFEAVQDYNSKDYVR